MMELDLGKKGTLKVLFYKECHETDYRHTPPNEICSGELTCQLGDNIISVKHREELQNRFVKDITRKWFEHAFPETNFGQFVTTSSGQLRVLIGHVTSGDVYETELRDTDNNLKRHLDCLAKVVRGDKKRHRTLSF